MRALDFDDQGVDRIFRETHELATWVVNQDELLDRKLLEARHHLLEGRLLILSRFLFLSHGFSPPIRCGWQSGRERISSQ